MGARDAGTSNYRTPLTQHTRVNRWPNMWPGPSAKPQTGREFLRRWRAALQGFRREASPIPYRWVVTFIQTPVGRWAHTCFDRAVVASRPGLQSNLSAGTHLGIRNLAPKHLGRKETTWNYLKC